METKTSCISKDPMMKLSDSGPASILNYNLPQSTTYSVVKYLKFDITPGKYKKKYLKKPSTESIWDLKQIIGTSNWNVDNIKAILDGTSYSKSLFLQKITKLTNTGTTTNSTDTKSGQKFSLIGKILNSSTVQQAYSNEYIANKIIDGYMPIPYKKFSKNLDFAFVKEPKKLEPRLYMVLHFKMATFLGDYGAGKTIKTFSLLPGEKTTISIRSYEHDEEIITRTQSVLDSFSESCSEDLQTTISESMQSTYTESESESETDTDKWNVSGEVSGGIGPIGGKVEGGYSSDNTTTESLNTSISDTVNTVNDAVSKQAYAADTERQIEINDSTTSTSETETEETITRTIENINKSRVLNFVFRQLVQEYYTVTYLDDVSFRFTTGYEDHEQHCGIEGIETLLKDVMANNTSAANVLQQICRYLCNVESIIADESDPTNYKFSLIESVTEKLTNILNKDDKGMEVSLIRKRKDIVQKYKDKEFNGIIVKVSSRIMRTPAVIVDSLLGQGEALDCYNQQMQDAAYTASHLENKKVEQAIEILNGITDPTEKAKLYKRVFGECCSDDVEV